MATRYEYYLGQVDNAWDVSSGIWCAQTFTPSENHTVTAVTIKCYRNGSPGTVTVSIKAVDGSGKPTGADLASGTFDPSDLPTSQATATQKQVSLGAGTALTSGTQYAIVVRTATGGPYVNTLRWIYSYAGTYTDGRVHASDDSGATWDYYSANNAPRDFLFEEWTGGAPTVTTQAVSDIAGTTATGNGNITDLGGPYPTAYGVCWNDSGTPTTADDKTDEGAAAATGAFTTAMTNLIPGTTYYVRSYAQNVAGTSYGDEVTFMAGTTPTVTQIKPSNIQATVATGHGNITDLGSPNPTQHGHCWNRTGTPTTSDSKTELGAASTTGGFTSDITDLKSGLIYYMRSYATNAKGTVYSSTTWSFIAGGGGEHKALSG